MNHPIALSIAFPPRLALLGLLAAATLPSNADEPVNLRITGNWNIELTGPVAGVVEVMPTALVSVSAQKIATLPIFKTTGGGWSRGVQLEPLRAQETTTPFLLVADSFVLRAGPEESSAVFIRGQDYELESTWGTIGRIEGGSIQEGQPVFASYQHGLLRLDSIIQTATKEVSYRAGTPLAAAPLPPVLGEGESRLANLWLPGHFPKLSPDHLFPILEQAYPEGPKATPSMAEQRFPKAFAKLQSGKPLRILAWGDSVTVGSYLPDYPQTRWQEQFVARLQDRFPQAKIELSTEAWGGRNTGSYLNEAPGSEHNYEEKVLSSKPDLIVSEFVNDAGLKEAQVEERYGKLLADFQKIEAEWIILTPHYTRHDWMGLDRERDIDDDPRPYVKGLRKFAANHPVGLADASLRYGRLWRQGLPHSTIMLNSINHPDARGMKLFADALMELFP